MSFYSGKKVFVTGHTGFKGSWLTAWLQMLGAEVTGYALEPDCAPNHFSLLQTVVKSNIADIRDENRLAGDLAESEAEIVFHLAAQPLVRRSYREPIESFEVNVLGTAKLLEACRKVQSVRAVVAVTTDKCYENREWEYPYREIDTLGGYDPYSASKACAEIVTASYRSSFFKESGIAVATARAGNVIGGGDWSEDRLVPDIIRAASAKNTAFIRNPRSVRPWQHVLESLNGYLILAQKLYEKEPVDEAWNFGPSDDSNLSVEDVLMLSKKEWDEISFAFESEKDAPHEAKLLRLDSSKAKARLGWQSKWSAQEAVVKTMEWYKTFYKNGTVLTKVQIEEFMKARG